MQKAALRVQLRDAKAAEDLLRREHGVLVAEHETTLRRLRLARAGLLVALPHVEAPPARRLVAFALEASGKPPEF